MELGPDAVVLVFKNHAAQRGLRPRPVSSRKRSMAFSTLSTGTGEHEAERVKELHGCAGELPGCGHGDDGGDVSVEHDGAAHGCDFGFVGVGDCFFDEALLDSRSHVARCELDEVFCFDGLRTAEKIEKNGELCAGATRGGDCGEGLFDIFEG